jgi:hypothetical protein
MKTENDYFWKAKQLKIKYMKEVDLEMDKAREKMKEDILKGVKVRLK